MYLMYNGPDQGGGVISSYLCGERFSKFQKDYSDQ